MSNYIENITNVQLNPNTYTRTDINTINLRNIPWVNDSMYCAFDNCVNLTTVSNIEQNVVNFHKTFSECYNLISVSDFPNSCDGQLTNTFRNCRNLLASPTLPSNSTMLGGTMDHTFLGCTVITDAPIIPSWVNYLTGTFIECRSLVNVPTIPNSVISMDNTFSHCTSLVNSPVIPDSVQNLASCFSSCTSLVNAPIIPNSVTNVEGTFSGCTSLVNAPVIPDSVTSLVETFKSCTNLTNLPNVSNNITNVVEAFRNCTSLTGNIYFNSNQITNAIDCFKDTNLTKNVYIPYYNLYTNNTNSNTRGAFINASYDENGTTDGVYLKNLTPTLRLNVIPADATIELEVNENTIFASGIAVPYNTVVNWSVSALHYVSQNSSQLIENEDITLNIELSRIQYAFTVNPIPSDATVKLESTGHTTVEGTGIQTIYVYENESVTYTVYKSTYTVETDTITNINDNISLEVELQPEWLFNIDEYIEATLTEYINNNQPNVVVPDIVYGEPEYTIANAGLVAEEITEINSAGLVSDSNLEESSDAGEIH